jgi:hypothetical protein
MTGLGLGFVFRDCVLVEVFGCRYEPLGGCAENFQTRHFCGLIGFVGRKQREGRRGKKILQNGGKILGVGKRVSSEQ